MRATRAAPSMQGSPRASSSEGVFGSTALRISTLVLACDRLDAWAHSRCIVVCTAMGRVIWQAPLFCPDADRGKDRDRFAALSAAHCRHANRKIPRGDGAFQRVPSQLVDDRPPEASPGIVPRARKWPSVSTSTITDNVVVRYSMKYVTFDTLLKRMTLLTVI